MDTVKKEKLFLVSVDVTDKRNPLRIMEHDIMKETPKTYFIKTGRGERRFPKEQDGVVKRESFALHWFQFYTTDETKIDGVVEETIRVNRERQMKKVEYAQELLGTIDEFESTWQALKREQERFKNGQ